jgi:DNA invertase Pin-like site-specific DNA recombinase
VKTINGIDAKLHAKMGELVGYPIRGKVHIDTDLALKLHQAGFSYKQIGIYFSVSGCTVKRRLREAGLL